MKNSPKINILFTLILKNMTDFMHGLNLRTSKFMVTCRPNLTSNYTTLREGNSWTCGYSLMDPIFARQLPKKLH